MLEIHWRRGQVAKAWLCKSLIPGSNPGDAFNNHPARMVELVDTQDLKSCVRKDVRVRPPLRVKYYNSLYFPQNFIAMNEIKYFI
jgi:hypothetical protein